MATATETKGDVPWVLTYRRTFVHVEIVDDSDEDDTPRRPSRRPSRAASMPAGVGRPVGCDHGEGAAAYFGGAAERRQLLDRSAPQAARDNRTPEMSRRAHLRSTMTTDNGETLTKTASFMTNSTICPDDDLCSDDDAVEPEWGGGATAARTMAGPDSGDAHGDDAHVAQKGHKPGALDTKGQRRMSDSPAYPRLPCGSHGKTLMLRNIPCRISHEELVSLLDQQGFAGRYDFVYVPLSHRPKANIGYAFVNLIAEADADAMKLAFDGFRFPGTLSQKVCDVQIAKVQGLLPQLMQRRRKARPDACTR